MTSYHECKCGAQIEMHVDLGENMVDIPDACEECGYKFTQDERVKIYNETLQDAWASAIDYAKDMMEDR